MFETAGMLVLFAVLSVTAGGIVLQLGRDRTVALPPSESLFVSFALGFMVLTFLPTLVTGFVGILADFTMSRAFMVGSVVLFCALLGPLCLKLGRGHPWPWFKCWP